MDLYKFIRMKYCPECAALNKKIKDRNRAKEVRQGIKEKNKQMRIELEELREKNKSLEIEIEILRKKLIEYREMLDL